MTPSMTVARAYERALFAGDMDAVARCLTDDVVYWVVGAPVALVVRAPLLWKENP